MPTAWTNGWSISSSSELVVNTKPRARERTELAKQANAALSAHLAELGFVRGWSMNTTYASLCKRGVKVP